jgi:hypothetical protein
MQEVGSGLSLDLTLDAAGALLDISARQGVYKSQIWPVSRLVALACAGYDAWLARRRHDVMDAAFDWCRLRDLNPRPSVYKTAALPLC